MNTGTMRKVMGAAAAAVLVVSQPAQAQRQVNERQATGATGTVEITVPSGEYQQYAFPEGASADWIRLIPQATATFSAWMVYS